jgi:hypothetical protein
MAMESRTECPSCQSAVVPQLWVDARNRLEHPRVVHLCPLCGATVRESGGGMNRGMLALIIGSICLFALMLILGLMKYAR